MGTYFFSSDVNKLVIGPIERLVDLVQKISANPLVHRNRYIHTYNIYTYIHTQGVEYKAMGAEEGFVAGMETTMLLTTIMKIGHYNTLSYIHTYNLMNIYTHMHGLHRRVDARRLWRGWCFGHCEKPF